MSKLLVREALDLCEEDDIQKSTKTALKAKSSKLKSKDKKLLFAKNGKNQKSLIEKYYQKINKSNLDDNLLYLKKISKPVANYDLISSALEKKPKSKSNTEDIEKDEPTAFTDEDFKNFAKSYFNRSEKN